MISFRKISAASKGKLIRAYLSEGVAPDDPGRRLAAYYAGRDPRASWQPDMAPGVARALGIDPTLVPGNEALERLFGRGSKTGYSWSRVDVAGSGDDTLSFSGAVRDGSMCWRSGEAG